jgi:hypothetical protein
MICSSVNLDLFMNPPHVAADQDSQPTKRLRFRGGGHIRVCPALGPEWQRKKIHRGVPGNCQMVRLQRPEARSTRCYSSVKQPRSSGSSAWYQLKPGTHDGRTGGSAQGRRTVIALDPLCCIAFKLAKGPFPKLLLPEHQCPTTMFVREQLSCGRS